MTAVIGLLNMHATLEPLGHAVRALNNWTFFLPFDFKRVGSATKRYFPLEWNPVGLGGSVPLGAGAPKQSSHPFSDRRQQIELLRDSERKV